MRSHYFVPVSLTLTALCLIAGPPSGLTQPPAPDTSAPARTQMAPDVAPIIKAATAAYKSLKTYQHKEHFTLKAPGQDGEITRNTDYLLALERPNKFCFKPLNGGTDAAVSDGKTFINYKPENRQYTRVTAPADLQGINIVDDVLFEPMATYLVALMLRGDALADKDVAKGLYAATRKSDVTENGVKYQVVSAPLGPNSAPLSFYFNAQTHLLARADFKLKQPPVTQTEVFSDVQTDKPVPASAFQFTPPTGAKLVAQFVDPSKLLAQEFEGKPAPDFTLPDVAGKEVSLSSLKGKVVVVDFWASWCGPCKRVMPTIQEIHEKYGKDVIVLAVNTSDEKADCDQFLKSNPNYTMRVLRDNTKSESIANKLYKVEGIPTTIIIDKEGVVRTYAIGAHDPEFYTNAVKSLGAS